jgi:hypothetical protein
MVLCRCIPSWPWNRRPHSVLDASHLEGRTDGRLFFEFCRKIPFYSVNFYCEGNSEMTAFVWVPRLVGALDGRPKSIDWRKREVRSILTPLVP